MKKILILISLMFPLIATAGPEDHIPGAEYHATSAVPYYLSSLVFDSIQLSADESHLVLEARYGNLSGEFKVIETVRHNEDKVRFIAEKIIINKWSSDCSTGEMAKVTIEGMNEAGNGMSAKHLKISVEYTTTPDTCHTRPQVQTIHYELSN
jgi:hypothetical protein